MLKLTTPHEKKLLTRIWL